MTDGAGEIDPQIEALLRADAGVIAAFGAKKVRLYNLAPPASAGSVFPYVTVGLGHTLAYPSSKGGDYEATLHVWSRPDPRSTAEAAAIAAALVAALDDIDPSQLPMASFQLVQSRWLDTQLLEDPDGMTVHGVVRLELSYDPA
jgi:hypothetical protein